MGFWDTIRNVARTAAEHYNNPPDSSGGLFPNNTGDSIPPHSREWGDYLPDIEIEIPDIGDLIDQGVQAVKDRLSDIAGEDVVAFAWAAVEAAIKRGSPADVIEGLRQEAARLEEDRDANNFYHTFCQQQENLQKQVGIEAVFPNKRCQDMGYNVGYPIENDGTVDYPITDYRHPDNVRLRYLEQQETAGRLTDSERSELARVRGGSSSSSSMLLIAGAAAAGFLLLRR